VRSSAGERVSEACTKALVEHGGGLLMVWGCFGNNQVGNLVEIEEILVNEEYESILERHVLPNERRLIDEDSFREDNDPKHSSTLYRSLVIDKEKHRHLSVMVWPTQSPDVSPI
jgi:hypothetical protein